MLTMMMVAGVAHRFRVRCKLSTGWDDFSPSSEAIQVMTGGDGRT